MVAPPPHSGSVATHLPHGGREVVANPHGDSVEMGRVGSIVVRMVVQATIFVNTMRRESFPLKCLGMVPIRKKNCSVCRGV